MKLKNVTFDAGNPKQIAEFWSAATGRPVAMAEEFFAMLEPDANDIQMLFIKVPEGKTAKNRMHVDFHATDREAEVERLVGLGATRGETHNMYGVEWTVLTDPEGNEFCVAK